ncbi:MAG: GTPase Obg [Candidatus Hepatoplasma vulgare]|nr:MAG: GTPase Obg [Candidatus Hepatoplasma sp.]
METISFIDEVNIKIKAGDGGNGISSFRREKYISRGGPDGGNGGHGGDIYFKATSALNTLITFKRKRLFKAENGKNGGTNNKTGKNGKNLIIEVPLGTEIIINNKKITDLFFNDQIYKIEEGGRGGRGNSTFKSSKNKAPTLHESGEKRDWVSLTLNLKVLADVGLLGYPNVGKSTFLSVISNAKPKIANYPFTTLIPKLGVIDYKGYSYVVTDLPGLIEGASENKGMGKEFLKHLSRTKIILHILDASFENKKERYENLRKELKKYSKELFLKEEIIAINKVDLIKKEEEEEILELFKDKKIFFISTLKKEGLNDLLIYLGQKINLIKKEEEEKILEKLEEDDYKLISLKIKDNFENEKFEIVKGENQWEISGKFPEYWAQRIPIDTHENFLRLLMKFKKNGIIKKLIKMGVKENDLVTVKNSSLIFEFKSNMF